MCVCVCVSVLAPSQVIVTQLHGVQAILHILLNVKDREDVIEPAVCTLRHLTTRHVNAEMAQIVLRDNYGIPVLVNFLQPHYKWPLIKVSSGWHTTDRCSLVLCGRPYSCLRFFQADIIRWHFSCQRMMAA